MTIYSPIPPEVIWSEDGSREYKLEEYVLEGVPVQVMVISGTKARLERILSTDPLHYLNPGLQPGLEIEFAPRTL